MEKFTIDLDKVLDDFEINEDREERLAMRASIVTSPEQLAGLLQNYERIQGHCDENWVKNLSCLEDGKPDLLGSVGAPNTENAEGALPDITVPSWSLEIQPAPDLQLQTATDPQSQGHRAPQYSEHANMDTRTLPDLKEINLTQEAYSSHQIAEFLDHENLPQLGMQTASDFQVFPDLNSIKFDENAITPIFQGMGSNSENQNTTELQGVAGDSIKSEDSVVQCEGDVQPINHSLNLVLQNCEAQSVVTKNETDNLTTETDYSKVPTSQESASNLKEDALVIGFSSSADLSDSELERMLDELEDEEANTNREECQPVRAQDGEPVECLNVEVTDVAHEPCAASSQERAIEQAQDNSGDKAGDGKANRPKSLEIPNDVPYPPGSTVTVGPPGNTPGSNVPSAASGISYTMPEEEVPEDYEASPSASSSESSSGTEEATALEESRPPSLLQSLGVLPPYWVPDAEAPSCMHCEARFTVIKRRHHCRACGKVLCSRCSDQKAKIQYLDNADARVCQSCFPILCAAQEEGANRLGRNPNPNNPMEYCSTVPPLQQASQNNQPPSVMVPVGVLKREGSTRTRGEPKQVMFSDGIRPGGDLTDLDGWVDPRGARNKQANDRTPRGPLLSPAASAVQGLLVPEVPEGHPRSVELRSSTMALVPSDLASYTLLADSRPGAFSFERSAHTVNLMDTLRNENEPPVVFALNKNLFVLVKVINLSCCVHKTVWCFTTRGLRCEGQDEMVFILEALPDENCVPRDVFAHISAVYSEAGKGNTVTELGHTTFHGPFLGSNEHGGFLYIRPTTQCLQRLVLPPPPYLVAILLQRWEAPWARLFPLRLLLRLGYEFRYYPCPLVSVRERRPVYCELGQTILDLLADFRNFTYTLPCIQGLVIQMDDRQTRLLIPRNRYDQVVRVLNNSNDHVLALGGSFCRDADSHLVCVQTADETYHTKAISILNRPRKITGASFLVFNGALKASSGLSAKSSIVEDGLMVQVTAETMQALCVALKDMKDFSVGCGPVSVQPPAEVVLISWIDDDHYFNVGVRSQIDGSKLDGIPSIRVHNGTDFRSENCFIRWTEVFLLKCEESNARTGTELDISRVSESISRAFCVALVPLLDLLATAGLLILAVRATLDPDNVCYEAGSNGGKLPPLYMKSLDDELVPVIHKAASQLGDGKTVLELVFSVMRH